MAKKKKKNQMKLIISATVGVLVVVLVVIIGLMFVTPNAGRLAASYKKTDVAFVGDPSSVGDGKAPLGVDAFFTGGELLELKGFTITYFEKSEDAKAFAKEAKGKLNDDTKKTQTVIRRGKAVYVGNKDYAGKFRSQIA